MKHQNPLKTDKVVIFDKLRLTCSNFVILNENFNRGILTVGLKTKTVGFGSLIFQRPPIFCFLQLCQFSSDFDVSYHFGIRRPNK
jgi:hypothetical protein